MNLEVAKYHMQELKKLIEQEPNHPLLCTLINPLEGILNSRNFQNIEAKPPSKK